MVYRASGLRSLGLIQVFIGVLMVVFGIASIAAIHHWSSYAGFGLWVGIWVVLTGLFGYLGSKSDDRPNNCLIGLMIGFSATACVFTGIMFIVYCIALAEFSQRIRCGDDGKGWEVNCHLYNQEHISYSVAKAGAGVGAVLLILALVEFFVALASSIYGCNATCCGVSTTTAGTVVQANPQVTYLNQPGHNVTILNASQGAVLPSGTSVQTVTTYPGQPMIIQTGNPQMIPQPFQTSYPGQPVVPQGYFAPPPYAGGAPQQ